VSGVPRLNVELPDELHRDAKAEAAHAGESLKEFVIEAVRVWVEESRRRREGGGKPTRRA
jgi:predicted HicB family RNase H-like nuclease